MEMQLTPEESDRVAYLTEKLKRIHAGEMCINKQGQVVPLTECPDGVPFPKGDNPFLAIHPLDAMKAAADLKHTALMDAERTGKRCIAECSERHVRGFCECYPKR